MIRLSDAVILAFTKIRTRRFRTFVTILVASILFGAIIFFVFLFQGVIESTNKFSLGTLSGRYLASTSYSRQISLTDSSIPKSVLDRAKVIYKKTIADKNVAAKKIGIDYDSSVEIKPTQIWYNDTEVLDSSSPSAIRAFNEYIATLPTSKQLLDETIKHYNYINAFNITSFSIHDGQLKMINNNIEKFDETNSYSTSVNTDVSSGWSYMDKSIVEPFLLSADQLNRQSDNDAIPIIAPISKVEEALGLKKLPGNASSTEKLDRIKYIRNNAEKAEFIVCYRNNISQAQIKAAIDNAKELKTNKDYKEPLLTFALPDDPSACAPASVLKDERSLSDKGLAKKQDEFDRMFGQETTPIQQKIKFRVVGLSPEGLGSSSLSGLGSLISTIAGSTLGGQWVIPQQMYNSMPNKATLDKVISNNNDSNLSENNYTSLYSRSIVEFDNIDDLKKFVTKVGCGAEICNGERMAYYFGNNSVLIDDVKNQMTKYLSYVVVVITLIAVIIMMSMVGRVISDSRRETAVFRAIGARRGDISSIYLIYTIMLSTIIMLVSLIIGVIVAYWFNATISPDASVQAHLIYIFSDENMKFALIGVWWQALFVIGVLIILAGLIGMLFPLVRNLARNPIKDMRDDT